MHESSLVWVWYSLLSGVTIGVSNYIMGVKLAQAGVFAASFTGPLGFVILVIYRIGECVKNKYRTGRTIDYNNSNWFKGNENRFVRSNIIPLLGNFIPNLLSLITVSLSFKYAALSGINQGMIFTLVALSSIYTSIIFYFKFHEVITPAQLIGTAIMIGCVVCLGLEGAQ